jgi:ferredoxin
VKNQFGLIAGSAKKEIHKLAPHPRDLSRALADLHSVVRPGLAIMDAVAGMDGNGPAGGRARRVGLLLASADGVALDAVAACVMGCKPGEVESTRGADARGLGVGQMDRIEVAGVPLDDARIADWRKPPLFVRSLLFSILPDWSVRWAYDVAGGGCAAVLDDRCILCGECIANCPVKAFRKVGGRLKVEESLCISCHCCSEVCKNRAIVMRRSFAGRVVHGLYRFAAGRRKR